MLKKAALFAFTVTCAWSCAIKPSSAKEYRLEYGIASVSFTYAPLYVAEDEGFFKKEGVDVEGVQMGGSGAAASATIAGSVQFYVGLPQTAALAVAKGQKLAAFAVVTKQYGSDIVVSKAIAQKLHLSHRIPVDKRLDALKGLRIAAWFPGGSPDMEVRFIAAKKGWNADHDLTILPIGPSGPMLAALKNDRVDAFAFSSPTSDEAVERMGAFIAYSGATGEWAPLENEPYMCLIANTDWLAANKNAAAAVYRGLADAMKFMREHPKTAKGLIRKRLRAFDDSAFEAGYKNVHFMIPNSPKVGKPEATKIEEFMKTLNASFNVPASRLVYPQIGALASPATAIRSR